MPEKLQASLEKINDQIDDYTDSMDWWTLNSYKTFLANLPNKVKSVMDIEEGDKQLVLEDPYYSVPKDFMDPNVYAKKRDENKDHVIPLKASFALYKEGKLVSKSKPRLVANIPLPTDHGTFILKGQEFAIKKQLRLSPGVYTTKRKDGRVHSQINSSKRQNIDVYFTPETSKFAFRVSGKSFPLYAVLNAMGVKEDKMRKAWGERIYNANKISGSRIKTSIDRLYGVMYKFDDSDSSAEDKEAKVLEALADTAVDPWVTNVTLGKGHDKVDTSMLMSITQKALNVSSGKEESDQREAMYFKKPFEIGDMVNYSLERNAGKIRGKIKMRLRKTSDMDSIISRPLVTLSSTIKRKYNEDELAHTPEQYNPLGIRHDLTEITLMGEGGISQRHMITPEARDIHDSSIGFLDPLHTPEGGNIGTNLHLTNKAFLKDGNLVQPLRSADGDLSYYNPREMYDQYVALPGQIKYKNGVPQLGRQEIDVLYKGKITKAPASKINLIMPGTPNDSLGGAAFIPFVNHNVGNRSTVAVKQMGQAVPLLNKEAPLVKSMASTGESMGSVFGRKMNVTVPKSIKSGVVTKVSDTYVHIKTSDGKSRKVPLRNNYQLNGDAVLNDTAVVKAGDTVKGGQIIAENQTSKDGELAIGSNLRVAFMPFYGQNHQDGIVISEDAAKKLTSVHSYAHEASKASQDVFNKAKFKAHYPSLYRKGALDKLDKDGIVQVGQIIEPGDPIILKMTPQELTEDDLLMGNINKAFKKPLRRDDKTWDGDAPARVRGVIDTPKGYKVYLETQEPAKVGDKISNFYGAKGVITGILAPDEMPKYDDGTVPDMIQNPASVPSRMNVGQIMEAMASRLAKHRGEPYMASNFTGKESVESLQKQLLDAGLATLGEDGKIDDRQSMTLPNGKKVKVFSGSQYLMKLKQQAAAYYGARGRKGKYDVIAHRPTKGPKTGALGWYAMLSHGATENLKELSSWKGERNDDMWRAFETGASMPAPKTTFAMDRLVKILNAAGINVEEKGDGYQLMPLTDADVDKMSKGEVPDPSKAVRVGKSGKMETLESEKGGLFDPKLFGGMRGENFGHVTLASPMPNPVFEKPIKNILGLSTKDYEALISGGRGVIDGKVVDIDEDNISHVKTRGHAFQELLGNIDVDKSIEELTTQYKGARGENKDAVAKKIRYLTGLKRAKKTPSDYLISKIPVIPPKFRPVYLRADNSIGVSDLTTLYQRVGVFNEALKGTEGLPSSIVNKSYMGLYNSVRELQTTGRTDGVRDSVGALRFLKGSAPKRGQFMSKIFAKREPLGGQATIMPDPKLDIDECRIPEDMAWTVMEPFVMRRLSQSGVAPLVAQKMVDERTNMASKALDAVLDERPVLLSRDPKLFKFNVMALKAKRTPGKAIYIPPLVTKGFNADFDGDRMSVRVPVGAKAVAEAWEKMVPSKNLFNPGKDEVIMYPQEDGVAGLYAGSRIKKQTNLKFTTPKEIIDAFDKGALAPTDGVKLNGVMTTPGRVLAQENVPQQLRDYSAVLTDKKMKEILGKVAENDPKSYSKTLRGLKDLGDTLSTEMGITFKGSDFIAIKDKPELARVGKGQMSAADEQKVHARLKKHLREDSAIALMADSGAKGSWNNAQQMLYSPIKVENASGKTVDHTIQGSYAGGLGFRDFFVAAKGSRKGVIDKSVETARPGAFGKELIRNSLGAVIQKGEDPNPEGIDIAVTHPTVLARYLAKDVKVGNKVIAKAGDPITSELVQTARRMKVKTFNTRSPLTTHAYDGMYAKDFGRMPGNKKAMPGTDVGVIASHAFTERAVQLMLKKFHAGGSAGAANIVEGLDPTWDIFKGDAPDGARAMLAPQAGKVTAINKLRSGAHEVYIDGKKTVTTPGYNLRIKAGDKISKGQQLQEGFPSPKDVLKYRGLRPMQMYMVEQLENSYGKHAPDRRYIEALVGNLTRYAKVMDPGDSDYAPGEIISINHMEKYNQGYEGDKKIKYEPTFMGIGISSAKAKSDWVSSMLHGDLARQLPDMAAEAATSAKHGVDPVMPYLSSSSFGDDKQEGRY